MILEPGTSEWLAARCGKVTASRVADLAMTTKKGEWTAARRKYLIELIAERLTGKKLDEDKFQSAAMLWGTETEPLAIKAYEKFRTSTVDPVGYIDHPSISMSGATPDGSVGLEGLLQIKCPETHTHVATLIERIIPEKYQFQMTWELACFPDVLYSDYVSFDPRITVPELRLAVIRFPRIPKEIASLEKVVKDFLNELDNTMATLEAGEFGYVRPKQDETSRVVRVEHLSSEDIARDMKPTPLFKK